MNFGKIGILYGGCSAERNISIMSGTEIYRALLSRGMNVHLFDTKCNDIQKLISSNFNNIFIALHGKYGEDGTIQGTLDLLNIPYTGSGPLASGLCMNKVMAKHIWLQYELPTPLFQVFNRNQGYIFNKNNIEFPVIVKPACEGSTLGVTKANCLADLDIAIRKALIFDDNVLIEKFIEGKELTVGMIGNNTKNIDVFPIVEIVAPNNNYDYEQKYFSDETKYFCPANLSYEIYNNIIEISKKSYNVLGCEGLARIDIIIDNNNTPWLLEINNIPGMTKHSLIPLAAKMNGLNYEDLCILILSTASCKYKK